MPPASIGRTLHEGWQVLANLALRRVRCDVPAGLWFERLSERGVRRRAEQLYEELDALRKIRRDVRGELLLEVKKNPAHGNLPGHVVFTMPHELNALALDNQRVFYDLLFTASARTLLKVAADPKHLGAEIGVISILHTWGQNLLLHPHIHCAIPAGGLASDRSQWIHPRYPFFLPVKVLSRVFRGKFCAGLKRLFRNNRLRCVGPAAALSDPKQFRR